MVTIARRGRSGNGRPAALLVALAIWLQSGSAGAVPLANSFADWVPGLQVANNWAYGWRNLAARPGPYDVRDFQLFLNDGSNGLTPVSQSGPNQWDGTAWDFGFDAPFTNLGQFDCHPNGPGSNGGEQWVIRRWSSRTSQPIQIIWQIANTISTGTGVTGHLFLEGVELASFSNDGVAEILIYYVDYQGGDRLDFAITPVGVDGDPSDKGDSVQTAILIDTKIPEDAMNPLGVVGDSVADFSEFQGQDGWHYGYYDQRLDVELNNLTYDVSDFVPFLNDGSGILASDPTIGAWMSHPNHWSGTRWELFDQAAAFQGPWTTMDSNGAHPAGNGQVDPSVHWAVRRWVSDFEGMATIFGTLLTGSAGDGVRGRFFADGFEYYSQLSDGTSVEFEVDVPVRNGTVLDFALDSDGSFALNLLDPTTLDSVSDTSDGSTFEILIEGWADFVPEPSLFLQLVAGAATLACLDRRRGRSSGHRRLRGGG